MPRASRPMQSARLVCTLLGSLILLFMHSATEARTWRIERDGSGDFTSLPAAMGSVASSDSLLIGPGDYTESFYFDYDGPEYLGCEAYFGVAVDSLTIIGTARDAVRIGPEQTTLTPFCPMGIAMQLGTADVLTIQSLTVRNLGVGVRLRGQAISSDVCVDSCDIGLYILTEVGAAISNGVVDSISARIWDGADDPEIQGFVHFEPFLSRSVPAEKKSMGGLKSLYTSQ